MRPSQFFIAPRSGRAGHITLPLLCALNTFDPSPELCHSERSGHHLNHPSRLEREASKQRLADKRAQSPKTLSPDSNSCSISYQFFSALSAHSAVPPKPLITT